MWDKLLSGKGQWKVKITRRTLWGRGVLSLIFLGAAYVVLFQSAAIEISLTRQRSGDSLEVYGTLVKRAYGVFPLWRVEFQKPYQVYLEKGTISDSRQRSSRDVRKGVTQLRVTTDTGRDIGLTPSRAMSAEDLRIRILSDTQDSVAFPSGSASNQEYADWMNAFLNSQVTGSLRFVLERERERLMGSIGAGVLIVPALLIGPLKWIRDGLVLFLQRRYAKKPPSQRLAGKRKR